MNSAAEARAELLGMGAVGEAEDEHVGVIAAESVRAGAQRQAFAEEVGWSRSWRRCSECARWCWRDSAEA